MGKKKSHNRIQLQNVPYKTHEQSERNTSGLGTADKVKHKAEFEAENKQEKKRQQDNRQQDNRGQIKLNPIPIILAVFLLTLLGLVIFAFRYAVLH